MADDDELFIITHTIEDNPPNIVDPTLQLPHHILHYIFFYLSFHDLLHVRLVNKNWYLNTPSHFNFHFNESLLRKRDPTSYSLNDLWDSIRSSIDTCKNKLINAEKRVLHVEFINVEYIRDIMKLLEENNFHEVYLKLFYDYLPYIFQSKCLTILHLTNCVLDKQHVLCDEVTIPSLQELKLERVTSSEEEILSKFISKCPNIRELSLVTCWGISFIVLTNLACLEKLYVNVSDSSSFTNIQVIAPRLQVFHFILRNRYLEIEDVVVTMDIRACKMLREFHLNCSKLPNGLDPENFCSDFPHLETLLMGPEKPINISGSSLRKWILSIPQDEFRPAISMAQELQ
uniref:F-box family protein n=1 Tax=Solanum tuberosum TaxID=4113 RepID=M1DU52_SOLTU